MTDTEIQFRSIADLLALAEEMGVGIGEVTLRYEIQASNFPRASIWNAMLARWSIMLEAMQRGTEAPKTGLGGLVSGTGYAMAHHTPKLLDPIAAGMAARALAVNECSAGMERIVAAPTAGSSGILPATLWGASQRLGSTPDQIVNALFVAAGLGMVMANNSTISGAKGGCMAEVGVSTGMAAGAACELAGGTPRQVVHAMALGVKNTLGLACDPVGGLVEVPCVKRNAMYSAMATVAAELALAGIESFIPPDEVISAMKEIGEAMPSQYKETACGGLAITPTGKKVMDSKVSL
ncbi:L-serine ammonia-lyase, iron-sulfur-dependent, subunit alpha [bacterium]|nr:L-serine ammonia-lyase, iron-sulfur-dependent, subunit alpha [bacterium]